MSGAVSHRVSLPAQIAEFCALGNECSAVHAVARPLLLDLFSGIGGFSLGLERAGFQTVAMCEIDPWCQRLLAKHWPHARIYTDVRELTAARLRADGIERVDAICGGFPCQDISLAGKGAGLDGERSGLWREFARLVGELRPRNVIVENVGAFRGRGLASVLGDFAAFGYDAQWHVIPAAAVGAPHLRERCWIVAVAADADHVARLESHRLGAVGEPDTAAHATGPGSSQLRGLQRRLARALAAASTPWQRTTEPPLRGVDDGLPAGLDGPGRARHAKLIRGQDRERTKGLGNAVVPLIPEIIGRCLLEVA